MLLTLKNRYNQCIWEKVRIVLKHSWSTGELTEKEQDELSGITKKLFLHLVLGGHHTQFTTYSYVSIKYYLKNNLLAI